MDNEKYLTGFVEILKNALSEHQNSNLTLQANLKFMDSALREQGEQITKYSIMIADLNKEKEDKVETENQRIKELENLVSNLEEEKNKKQEELSNNQTKLDAFKIESRDEMQKLKNQVEHLNEVNSSLEPLKGTVENLRNENTNLKNDIANLQNENTNLKNDIAIANSTQSATQKSLNKSFIKKAIVSNQVIEDGGNF